LEKFTGYCQKPGIFKNRERDDAMLRRFACLFLAMAVLCPAAPAFAEGEGLYSDIGGHWAQEVIERWTSRGIVEGYGGEFRPDEILTRAQMAKILSVLLGLPEAWENPFSDVSESDWFAAWIMRCYAAGIIVGNGMGADPDGKLTREQAVVMLARALELPPADERALEVFNDFERVSGWAAPYAAAMVSRGFISGAGGGFSPGNGITRAEFLTMLDRAVVQYINEDGEYDLAEGGGIVLCAAPEVVLKGKSSASVLISRGADGGKVSFSGCTLEGTLTVAADNVLVNGSDSSLPIASVTGRGSVVSSCEYSPGFPGAMSQECAGLLLSPGETRALSPVLYPEGETAASLSWASSDSGVVGVSQDGTVSALAPGSAEVTVSAPNGVKLVYMASVRSAAPVSSVSLGTEVISLTQGETYAFSPVLRPDWALDKSLVWSSSDGAVAAVSQEGVVSAGEAGSAVITAASPAGASASCAVEVKSPLRDLSEVGEAVRSAVEGYHGSWSVYIQDVGTGSSFSLNNERALSASLIKLYVMAAVLEGLEDGSVKDSPTLQMHLTSMITYSNNVSWKYLGSVLGGGNYYAGMQRVTELCGRYGYMDSGRIQKDGAVNSFTSVEDTGHFLSRVLDGTNVSEAASARMLALLKAQTKLSKIPAGVPKGIVTANKTGELFKPPIQNDAAIIFAPNGTYILVVMTNGGLISEIRSLSALVYGYMSRQ